MTLRPNGGHAASSVTAQVTFSSYVCSDAVSFFAYEWRFSCVYVFYRMA